jgi:hypothetical protein
MSDWQEHLREYLAVRHGKPMGTAFRYGSQDDEERMGAVRGKWEGLRAFVATSTKGLAASMSPSEEVWMRLGVGLRRRGQRGTQLRDRLSHRIKFSQHSHWKGVASSVDKPGNIRPESSHEQQYGRTFLNLFILPVASRFFHLCLSYFTPQCQLHTP